VPAYIMGISPADLTAYRLVHCTQIGGDAIVVIDRKNNRAIKIDIATGVLPYDRELLKLRGRVIMKKRVATREEHCRFFDRLAELIVKFVRVDASNFRVIAEFTLPWQEYSEKLSFMPSHKKLFHAELLAADLSPALVEGLVGLEIIDPQQELGLLRELRSHALDRSSPQKSHVGTFSHLINNPELSTAVKVQQVIDNYIIPVLENDGGMLELLDFDKNLGTVTVRFLGSCANCPSSLLSVETIVKPPLLNIPGVHHVIHRTHISKQEMPKLPILSS
jgi:Fe-S cluster biogenesis protein NfuA